VTVIERIEAARALKSESSSASVEALGDTVLHDRFWGVSVEAAKTLGSLKTDNAYKMLTQCLSVQHPKVKRAVVKALGEFRKSENLELLRKVLEGDTSYFVESEAATAIGKTRERAAIPLLKRAVESSSFQNIVAQGAIAGLKEFADEDEIAELLVEKSKYGNHHRVREAATFALGRYVSDNRTVFDHLKTLLTDSWFRVRINACRALAEGDQIKAIQDLSWLSEHDLDHRVRRVAEESILMIRQSASRPKGMTSLQDEVDRIKSRNLELMQKMDRLERQLR
jgi:aminopeptidase N